MGESVPLPPYTHCHQGSLPSPVQRLPSPPPHSQPTWMGESVPLASTTALACVSTWTRGVTGEGGSSLDSNLDLGQHLGQGGIIYREGYNS